MNAINRQKFLAELAKLLTFMYEEDRRYALDMYERMFDIAEGNEQWLIQNLMSPTRQAVIIARSYDAKERKLSVSAEWKEAEDEDQSGETPPFVLAINKIFDDLFPDDEGSEEPDNNQVSFFDQDETSKKETKKHRMPKAAVLLNQTQEFESVTAEAAEEIDLESILREEAQEDFWTGQTDTNSDIESEPDPRVQIVDRAEIYESAEDEPAGTGEALPAAGTDSEPPSRSGPESVEQQDTPHPKTEASVEEQLKATQQIGERPKKRRSIEELLGFRKEKKRSEEPESTGSKPASASEQAATESHPDLAKQKQKADADPVGTDESPRNLPDQNEQADAPVKAMVKAVPLEISDPEPKEEQDPEKTTPEKPTELPSAEENSVAAESKPASESKAPEESKPAAESKPPEESKPAAESKPAEENKPAAESKPAEENKPAAESKPAEENKPAAESKPAEENKPDAESKSPEESKSAAHILQKPDAETKAGFFSPPKDEPVIRKPEPKKKEEKAVPVKRVPNVPAMILFFIIAIPSVPVMVGILAILVALCVSLSFGMIALGSILVISAFSGFAVLADILLLLGAAIIALALGLLLLWLALWLIAEVMAGLIRSIGSLYREWCYKEVPAE